MKKVLVILILTLFGFYSFSQDNFIPEKFDLGLMKTKTGARVIYNGEKNSFTFDIVGENINPTEQKGFIIIDNNIFQTVILPFPQKVDFKGMTVEEQKANLLAYRDYEIDYFKNQVKLDITNLKYDWLVLNDKVFLFWYFNMPVDNETVRKQLYLTSICFDHILNLNTVQEKDKDSFKFGKELLVKIGETLELNEHVLDIEKLSQELN